MANCKNCGNELPEGALFCPRCGAPVTKPEEPMSTSSAGVPSQPTAASGTVLAFWWERFIAWLIDVIIVGIFTFILGILASIAGNPADFSTLPGWPWWLAFFISFNLEGVFRLLYWMFMEGSSGQSFGKALMRIRVMHLDGSPISLGDAAVESIGKAFFLPLDLIIGWILYPRKRQRVFNYLSRTIVVKVS